MLSRTHTAYLTRIGIARAFAVALLALVLLAGLIPAGALAALHTCKMACCAVKPPHEAGACNTQAAALPAGQDEAAGVEADAEQHSSHHGGVQMSGAADGRDVSSGHCHTAQRSSEQHPATRREPSRQAGGRVVQSFNRPCSPDCIAAALTTAQGKRPREAATHSIAVKPRPPIIVSRAGSSFIFLPSSVERRRRFRPRAPPVVLVNLSA